MPRLTKELPPSAKRLLHSGCVIPAHPLALDNTRKLDRRRQKALTKYYIDAGSGGVAVGVHTTQFSIRQYGLYEEVLRLASEAVEEMHLNRPFIKIAGVCGLTEQAVLETQTAADIGYDMVLLSPVGAEDLSEEQMLERARRVMEILPVFGFYLQPAVGGRPLSFNFWKELVNMDGLLAIKIAPFNRYETIKVVRAVAFSKRRDQIALYTGNDDNIVSDLLTPFRFNINGKCIEKRIVGGLLGQFAIWTKFSVNLLDSIKTTLSNPELESREILKLLELGVELTDANSAIFDSQNNFKGVIPGIHEILRRQGLLQNRFTLDPSEDLSPGQLDEIERILKAYPHLHATDDLFIQENLNYWLE